MQDSPDFTDILSKIETIELTTLHGRITEIVGMLIRAIVPNVKIGEGCAIGALTLINKDCDEFSIYTGNPANKIGKRLKHLSF